MTVYLNGKFLPIEDAKVSVLDRGFIYGDGVYELVPVYQPAAVPACRSISRGCSAVSTASGSPIRTRDAEWEAIIRELIARQPFDDQGVYFQVTRGVAKRDHAFPAERSADRVHDEQSAGRCRRASRSSAAWRSSPLPTSAGCTAT